MIETYISLMLVLLWIYSSIRLVMYAKNTKYNVCKSYIMELLDEYGFESELEEINKRFYRLIYFNVVILVLMSIVRIIFFFRF